MTNLTTFFIIVRGDLNARTGRQNGIVDMLTDPLSFESKEVFQERNSQDSIKKMCLEINLLIFVACSIVLL